MRSERFTLARARKVLGFIVAPTLIVVGAAMWLAFAPDDLPTLELSPSDGRLVFGVLLGYLPLILIALLLQARTWELTMMDDLRSARARVAGKAEAMMERIESLRIERDELQRALTLPPPVHLDERARQRARFEELSATIADVEGLAAEIAAVPPTDHIDRSGARITAGIVTISLIGILLALVGVILPIRWLMIGTLLIASLLTLMLSLFLLYPWVHALSDWERDVWIALLMILYAAFSIGIVILTSIVEVTSGL